MIILQLYPNGEYSQGVDSSSRRKSRAEKLSDQLHSSLQSTLDKSAIRQKLNAEMSVTGYSEGTQFISASDCTYTYLCRDEQGYHYAVEDAYQYVYTTCLKHSPERLIGLKVFKPPLVHQTVESCETPYRNRKRLEKMTSNMARRIRNAAFLLQHQHGKDKLSFLTLTLPNLPSEGLQAVVSEWDNLVHRFMDWLRIRVNAKGMEFQYVYCTEIQMQRLQQRNEYAPHLHLVFRGKRDKKSGWAVNPKQCRSEWVRCIKSVYCGDFVTSAVENLQIIRKSVSRYLSKYLSKGSCSLPKDDGKSPIVRLRTQWGGMSRCLSRSINTQKIRFVGSEDRGFKPSCFLKYIPQLIQNQLVCYHKAAYIPIIRETDTLPGKYLAVSTGCLSTPTICGGLAKVWDFLQPYFLAESYEEM
jgi:hypothetical protein